MDINQDTTLDEVIADPKKFGLPTFEEFKKNPKLLKIRTDLFDSIDNGPQRLLKNHIQKIRYQWKGYYFDKLEQVATAIENDGYDPKDLDYQPELIPQGGGKCNVVVRIVRKDAGSKDAGIQGESRGG